MQQAVDTPPQGSTMTTTGSSEVGTTAAPQLPIGRYLIRYPDTQLVVAAGAPDPTHILGPEYRDDPPEAPTMSQFDEQFLHRHAMAWSADHRSD